MILSSASEGHDATEEAQDDGFERSVPGAAWPLNQIINLKHELAQLAGQIDWDFIDGEIAPLYNEKGRPGVPTRFAIGLLLLKQIYGAVGRRRVRTLGLWPLFPVLHRRSSSNAEALGNNLGSSSPQGRWSRSIWRRFQSARSRTSRKVRPNTVSNLNKVYAKIEAWHNRRIEG
jgi:hypothetical protein